MEISFSFIKGWLLHQPTVSDGYTASICPGVVSCSKSALILTNSVCIQSSDGKNLSTPVRPGDIPCCELPLVLADCICVQPCKLSGLLVSVSLLKELQAFLTLLIRNPLSEGRCFFFHFVLLGTIRPIPTQ